LVQGVVLDHIAQPEVPETKAVDMLLDEQPALTLLQLQLARYLADSYLAPVAASVSLMLPPGIGRPADVLYELTPAANDLHQDLPAAQERVLTVLRARGALRGGQLNRALPQRNWRTSIRALVNRGLLKTTPLPPLPSAKPKTVRTAELLVRDFSGANLGRGAAQQRREKILQVLQREAGPVDAEWLYAESGGNLADLHALAELGLVRLGARETMRDPLADLAYDPNVPPKMTADQERAWNLAHEAMVHAQQGLKPPPLLPRSICKPSPKRSHWVARPSSWFPRSR
jgi:primosomal protein N'